MNKRSDAQNMITLDIPLEPIKTYFDEKQKLRRQKLKEKKVLKAQKAKNR